MIYKIASWLEIIKLIIAYLIIVLILVFVFLFKRFPKIKTLNWLNKIFISLLIIIGFSLSLLNAYLWKNDPISYRLLPPYSSLNYILKYSWQHYLATSIITIIFALILFIGIKSFNKKFNETFFYDEEPYLAMLGILLTGWPNCLLYLILVLFLGVISHLIYLIIFWFKRKIGLERMIQGRDINVSFKKGEVLEAPSLQMSANSIFRLSLLYFWLPSALLTLLLGGIISKYFGIIQLTI